MPTRLSIVLCVCMIVGTASSVSAQQALPPELRGASQRAEASPEVADHISTTSHVTRVGGKEIRYTVNAGTMVLHDQQRKPKASVFFVAYTQDGVNDPRSRPLTFAYNGGPGAASIWLHMGALGPRRVQMSGDGFQPAPPFSVVDNELSMFDVTDLVMIDPVGTGFSRPLPGEQTQLSGGCTRTLSGSPSSSECTWHATAGGCLRSSCSARATAPCGPRPSAASCSRDMAWS